MIVENPATQPHYLTQFFPVKPKVIDKDRTKNGDYYRKPTQYWFVNCEPESNVVFEPIECVEKHTIMKARLMKGEISTQTKRIMIHHQYATRFIKQYVLDAPGGVWIV